jgi:hypothetical protein
MAVEVTWMIASVGSWIRGPGPRNANVSTFLAKSVLSRGMLPRPGRVERCSAATVGGHRTGRVSFPAKQAGR